MIKIGVPKETKPFERRVSLTPEIIKQLSNKGLEFLVEKDAGKLSFYYDVKYTEVAARIEDNTQALYQNSDLVIKVNAPTQQEISWMKRGSTLICLAFPSLNTEVIIASEKAEINLIALESIPRISRAQKMDILSSQANLAGYKAVLIGAAELGKVFPMLMTAAGTIKPANVVIMGAGVAGLQAIATAKRLGAIVHVSDVRPETKEQVESLGAKFIEVNVDEKVSTEGGYVKNLSPEYLAKQKEIISKFVAQADLVITTALIPGKKAPVLITTDMLENMKPGSVIVDMAVEQGGNCEKSKVNEKVEYNGVTIIGESNLPSLAALNASDLFAKNIQALILHLLKDNGLNIDETDEITKGCLLIKNGTPIHPSIKLNQTA
jgi:H+-translocating NAD(P) transhydrogenase subunit alpha